MSNWRRICVVFPREWYDLLAIHLPDLMVDCDLLLAQPTAADPLASKARMHVKVNTDTQQHLLSLSIDGEETPLLEPAALQMYVIVQWPGLFKVRSL